MRLPRGFLREHQVVGALLLLVGSGTVLWFCGGVAIPLPGIDLPVPLASIFPGALVAVCLSCLDGSDMAWAEHLAPRELGPARVLVLGAGLLLVAAVTFATGARAFDATAAWVLVRALGAVVGPAAVGWLWGGRAAGSAVAIVSCVAVVIVGQEAAVAAGAWSPWALLPAGSVLGWLLASGGVVVSIAAAASRDVVRARGAGAPRRLGSVRSRPGTGSGPTETVARRRHLRNDTAS